MRLKIVLLCLSCITLLACVQAQNTYIPYELGGDNYYTMYGGPSLSASIAAPMNSSAGIRLLYMWI